MMKVWKKDISDKDLAIVRLLDVLVIVSCIALIVVTALTVIGE